MTTLPSTMGVMMVAGLGTVELANVDVLESRVDLHALIATVASSLRAFNVQPVDVRVTLLNNVICWQRPFALCVI